MIYRNIDTTKQILRFVCHVIVVFLCLFLNCLKQRFLYVYCCTYTLIKYTINCINVEIYRGECVLHGILSLLFLICMYFIYILLPLSMYTLYFVVNYNVVVVP